MASKKSVEERGKMLVAAVLAMAAMEAEGAKEAGDAWRQETIDEIEDRIEDRIVRIGDLVAREVKGTHGRGTPSVPSTTSGVPTAAARAHRTVVGANSKPARR